MDMSNLFLFRLLCLLRGAHLSFASRSLSFLPPSTKQPTLLQFLLHLPQDGQAQGCK